MWPIFFFMARYHVELLLGNEQVKGSPFSLVIQAGSGTGRLNAGLELGGSV